MSENNKTDEENKNKKSRPLKDYIPLILIILMIFVGIGILIFTDSVLLSYGITVACLIMITITYAKKNKSLAVMLTFMPTPFVPFSRIYIGDFQWYSLPLWLIPFAGNIYDFLALTKFTKHKLEPDNGWAKTLFEGIPILEKI